MHKNETVYLYVGGEWTRSRHTKLLPIYIEYEEKFLKKLKESLQSFVTGASEESINIDTLSFYRKMNIKLLCLKNKGICNEHNRYYKYGKLTYIETKDRNKHVISKVEGNYTTTVFYEDFKKEKIVVNEIEKYESAMMKFDRFGCKISL